MASLRTVSYGYAIKNGVVVVESEESKNVAEIFSLYLSGQTLQNIADSLTIRAVPFYHGEVRWNKNSIKRIIDNEKYIGDATYPRIISEEIFRSAHQLKDGKGGSATKVSPLLEYLKEICACGKCGARYKRINTWGSREKWMCSGGCKTLLFVSDELLESAILKTINIVIENPELLNVTAHSQYIPSKTVTKEENELNRLLEQPKISFSAAAKSILHNAALRFECCEFDRAEVTQALKDEFTDVKPLNILDLLFVKRYIRKIKVYPNGRLTVVFYNSAEITAIGGTDDGSDRTEKSNQN